MAKLLHNLFATPEETDQYHDSLGQSSLWIVLAAIAVTVISNVAYYFSGYTA